MRGPDGGRVTGKTFHGLAGDACDEVEVLVHVEHGEPGEFGCCGDEQLWDRWCPVLGLDSQHGLDLEGSALDRSSEVLHRHGRDRRGRERRPGVRLATRRVADLESGHCGHPHQASLDASRPLHGVGTIARPYQGGLVDQPFGQRHASSMISMSARSGRSRGPGPSGRHRPARAARRLTAERISGMDGHEADVQLRAVGASARVSCDGFDQRPLPTGRSSRARRAFRGCMAQPRHRDGTRRYAGNDLASR